LGIAFGILSIIAILLSSTVAVYRYFEHRYFTSLPTFLKDERGKYYVNSALVRRIEALHKDLLLTMKSKFFMERSPARLLDQCEVRNQIDKFVHGHCVAQICDSKCADLNNENTKQFFELMHTKYKITYRALLKTVLYVRHEIEYFSFRDSVAAAKPDSFKSFLRQCLKYEVATGRPSLDTFSIKRMTFEFGFTMPLLPLSLVLQKARNNFEYDQFAADSREESISDSSDKKAA
jgi:hypothetical protein